MTKEQEIELDGLRNALLYMSVMYMSREERAQLLEIIQTKEKMDNAESLSKRKTTNVS